MFRVLLIFSLFCFIEPKRLTPNETTVLISKYARVSRWGDNKNETKPQILQGRSNSGQSLWTHRSDVNIIGGQNKAKEVRHYPVYTKPSPKVDHVKVEKIPAVGEVIQDRFNPKPYFGYGAIAPNNQVSATYAPAPVKQPIVAATPPPAFPAVFNVAPASDEPPVDLYTSPYSSYNPPAVKPDLGEDSYPPGPEIDSYAATPTDDDTSYNYEKPKESAKQSTLGPPLSPNHDLFDYKDTHHNHHLYEEIDAPPSDHNNEHHDSLPEDVPDHMAPYDSDNMHQNGHSASGGAPNHPPASIDDIYYPPDFPVGQEHPKAVEPSFHADFNDHIPHEHFPKYLYDDPHFDHHIYEEIPHTTTEAPEDKRVSSVNYSYYYLGRKLWYIPLYFSIYFMFYVTALILKSIARHKIDLKHEWASSHSRGAREMTFDQIQNVDNIHKNVSRALDTAQKIYDKIAM